MKNLWKRFRAAHARWRERQLAKDLEYRRAENEIRTEQVIRVAAVAFVIAKHSMACFAEVSEVLKGGLHEAPQGVSASAPAETVN